MRIASTLIIAASIGLIASICAPSAEAGVVIGVSIPVPVLAPVVLATVPVAPVYVNPVFPLYLGGHRYRDGYRGYRHPGYVRGGYIFRRR